MVSSVAERVEALRKRIAQESDQVQKAALERQVANSTAYLEQVKEVTVTPPNVSFDRTMTLMRGRREIRLLYLGRGHTDTDVVTYLPRERIVCTGDLMESLISYAGDSYPEEWIATLEKLKALDFDTVMPGHGVVFKGKDKITAFQKYLRDVLTQVTALRKQGLAPDWMVTLAIPDRYDRLEPALVEELIQSMAGHAPDVAEAMRRGATVLESKSGYLATLGTQSFEVSENPAFRALPSV